MEGVVRMRLSSRSEYGVRAMVELAASHGGGPVSIREVAEREGIPEKYLEQLFSKLRKAGLVKGSRGSGGGYMLTREPHTISVGDVMRAVDGPISVCGCTGEGAADGGGCAKKGSCAAHPVWDKLQKGIVSILDSTALSDLAEGGTAGASPELPRNTHAFGGS